jgi:hypothetical protein
MCVCLLSALKRTFVDYGYALLHLYYSDISSYVPNFFHSASQHDMYGTASAYTPVGMGAVAGVAEAVGWERPLYLRWQTLRRLWRSIEIFQFSRPRQSSRVSATHDATCSSR